MIKETTDLVTDNEALSTIENITFDETLTTTELIDYMTSDSTNDTETTEAVIYSSSTKLIEGTTPSTGATKIIISGKLSYSVQANIL